VTPHRAAEAASNGEAPRGDELLQGVVDRLAAVRERVTTADDRDDGEAVSDVTRYFATDGIETRDGRARNTGRHVTATGRAWWDRPRVAPRAERERGLETVSPSGRQRGAVMGTGPDQGLAVVVAKQRSQRVIDELAAAGVYDDDRRVREWTDETVAIPVTEPPESVDYLEVVRQVGEPRLRTLEDHLREMGWTDDELDLAPSSWAVVGSVVLVELGDAPRPAEVGEALLSLHGEADTVLSRGRSPASTGSPRSKWLPAPATRRRSTTSTAPPTGWTCPR